MDNPQHYQPLSHALHPPPSALSRGQNTHYANTAQHASYNDVPKQPTQKPVEAEEDDEEEDDDDEGLVEEQLNQNDVDMHGSENASPQPSSSADVRASTHAPHPSQPVSPAPEQKRRPGRPRGSKNRRPRVGSAKHESSQFYYPPPAPEAASGSTTAPQHTNINPQNQHYYEFQWRVLNLCAEFYGAAEELVKGTPSLVIAQCYSMGPGAKVDPLVMIAEAKSVCDALLSNPSQLITNPPPPNYPIMSTIYHPMGQSNPNSVVAIAAPTTTISSGTPNIITNPQTFVVPLGVQPPFSAYPIYSASPGQYPTTPYYQYAAYGQPGVQYATPSQPNPPPTAPPVAHTSTPPVSSQPTATITTTPATGGTVIGNQGAWSDEETEQLKKMAEESRSKGTSGEIEWDWVIQEWGISRTRHQILIKATALGLKESSSRGTKRRRDADEATIVPPPMASLQQPSNSAQIISSPAQSTTQTTSTPAASPAMQSQQRPSSSKGPGTLNSSAPTLPWPMPTVAVNTPSPVLSTTGNSHDAQRSSYYRPRPNQDSPAKASAQSTVQHSYYTATGQITSNLRPSENGK